MAMDQQDAKEGDIPVLSVSGANIPQAWEKALLAVWHKGVEVRTEYDRPQDPPSLDATVLVEVRDPLAEPRIHKNFPGGPIELEVYRQEVLHGIHDHWINPAEGKWTYTYHQRLFGYPGTQTAAAIDQVEWMMEKLCEAPHSRRAQAITWIPHVDPPTDDPPCLQRMWARLLPDGEGYRLNLNTHWRSRDLYKAWFMNVFAITDLQRWMAERIAQKLRCKVGCGRYVDVSDSLHIYGSYRTAELAAEIEKMKSSPYTERAWDSAVLEPMFEEARQKLSEDPDHYAKGHT